MGCNIIYERFYWWAVNETCLKPVFLCCRVQLTAMLSLLVLVTEYNLLQCNHCLFLFQSTTYCKFYEYYFTFHDIFVPMALILFSTYVSLKFSGKVIFILAHFLFNFFNYPILLKARHDELMSLVNKTDSGTQKPRHIKQLQNNK